MIISNSCAESLWVTLPLSASFIGAALGLVILFVAIFFDSIIVVKIGFFISTISFGMLIFSGVASMFF